MTEIVVKIGTWFLDAYELFILTQTILRSPSLKQNIILIRKSFIKQIHKK